MKSLFRYTQFVCFLGLLFSIQQVPAQSAGGAKTVKDSLAKQDAVSPEPWESQYQQAFGKAQATSARVIAFRQYFEGIYASTLHVTAKQSVIAAKIKQLVDVDFYALHELRMALAKDKDMQKAKFFFALLQQHLTAEQNKAFTDYLVYFTSAAGATVYNQTAGSSTIQTKPTGWPNHLPLPGFGWGKTTSTEQVETPVSTQYHLSEEERYAIIMKHLRAGKKVSPDDMTWALRYEAGKPNPKPAQPAAKPAQPAPSFSATWASLEGSDIIMNGVILFIPKGQNITKASDMALLYKVRSQFSYNYYYHRNVFSSFADQNLPVSIEAGKIVSGLEHNTYIVHEIKACGHCLGQGSFWYNETRTRSVCKHCEGSGCRVTAIFNNGSVRAY
ncbi:MAG: hypothetical protein IT252_01995 [Chitinophagaceae bacterium]|nr:hypothetical protein [Chitinophagaceae bacterium]